MTVNAEDNSGPSLRNSVKFTSSPDLIESEQTVCPQSPPTTQEQSTTDVKLPKRIPSYSNLSPKNDRAMFHSPNLRSNLTREQRDRDPLFFYEIIKTLGVGSIGSVALVRKRGRTVGGSARKDVQEAVRRQKRHRECLNIPFIGGLFRLCIDGDLKHEEPQSLSDSFAAIFQPKESLLTSSRSNPSIHASENGDSSHSPGSTNGGGNGQSMSYAMKSIHLNRVTDSSFLTELRNEISILKKLDHPHIVRAIETFEHRNQIFIVMELCSGGDLYSRDPYTEEEAARIVSSILSAIAYMHLNGVYHRDIKHENICFANSGPKAEVKLIDFGLSKTYGDNSELTDGAGTIYTMAPEVLRGSSYTAKADVWSVGVVAYMLLSSQMPFYGRKRRHIAEQILNCQYGFKGRRWRRISDQAKNFIEDLLVLDEEERMDAQTALASTWLNRRFAATTRGPDVTEENMARHAMLRYAGYTKLKKMALMVVAHKSSSEEIGILRKIFQKYDKNRDGSINFDGFCCALEEFGHSQEDLEGMFEAVDLDGTGKIRYTEFLAATIEAHGAISEERLAEAFDRLDADDSGQISAENLAEILGQDFPRAEIDEIIADADLTQDNQISYAEFLALWEDKHEQARLEQLRLLGTEILSRVVTEPEINSFRGSSLDLGSDHSDEVDPAEARANFILQKHESGKRASSIQCIDENTPIDPTLLID